MPIHHSLTGKERRENNARITRFWRGRGEGDPTDMTHPEYSLILSEFYEASARFRAAKLKDLSRVVNEMEFYAVKARMEKAAEALDLAERTMLGH